MFFGIFIYLILGIVNGFTIDSQLSWIENLVESSYLTQNDIHQSFLCDGCQKIAKYIQYLPEDQAIIVLEKIIQIVCERKKLEVKDVCDDMIKQNGGIIIDNLYQRYLSPEYLCNDFFKICPQTEKELDYQDYVKEILLNKTSQKHPISSKNQTYKILQISDIHIDMQYQEGSAGKCTEPLCCRKESKQKFNSSQTAGFWGFDGLCDIPLNTLDKILNFASQEFQDQIDFILWTGDNPPHNIWNQSYDYNFNENQKATELIKKYFNKTLVLPVIGNHEFYPCNQYDFKQKNNKLISNLYDLWKDWLSDEAKSQFKQNGFYAMNLDQKNLKIIGLNTQACNNLNFFFFKDPTDPGHMLEWLRQELEKSEKLNQHVYIIGHIPSSQDCLLEWSMRYKALIDRFSFIIRGQFFGHLHTDDMTIYKSYVDDSTTGILFIPGSLTTYGSGFPTFRIYQIDVETNLPVNYQNYYLNLTHYNSIGNQTEVEMYKGYDFLESYDLKDLSFDSIDQFSFKIKNNQEIRNKYMFNHLKQSVSAKDLSLNTSNADGYKFFLINKQMPQLIREQISINQFFMQRSHLWINSQVNGENLFD